MMPVNNPINHVYKKRRYAPIMFVLLLFKHSYIKRMYSNQFTILFWIIQQLWGVMRYKAAHSDKNCSLDPYRQIGTENETFA